MEESELYYMKAIQFYIKLYDLVLMCEHSNELVEENLKA